MAKFYGTIGFAMQTETKPGVWKELLTERKYYGEVIRDTRRYQSTGNLNDNINFDNQISIVADNYANSNFGFMKYVEFNNVRWKIKSVEVKYPRLILSIGDVYNG